MGVYSIILGFVLFFNMNMVLPDFLLVMLWLHPINFYILCLHFHSVQCIFIFLENYFSTHGLLLIVFKMFGDFHVMLLSLVPRLISLWFENILVRFKFFNLLRFILWSKIRSILVNVSWELKKNKYFWYLWVDSFSN
jgi:hypothetical protein